jgi:hypothetical protein
MRLLPATLTAVVLSLICSSWCPAGTLFYTGTFLNDDDVALIDFSVATSTKVTLFSTSYATGGFDPLLSVFDSAGNLVAVSDDEDVSLGLLDFRINVFLSAGDYRFAITQATNYPQALFTGGTLSEGFLFDGQPNFTEQFGCANGQFCSGFDGSSRTAEWAFQVQPVPEPATLALSAACLIGIAAARRRR